MQFSKLSNYLSKLEQTSSRIEITKILADLFKQSDSADIDKVTYLVLGSLAPSYKGIVFNIADKLVVQAIAKAFDKDLDEVKQVYQETGDLGLVAQNLSNSHDSKITVNEIYKELLNVANDSGDKSVERKITGFSDVLKALNPLGARYITRIVLGKLRLGFSEKTIIDALSWMESGNKNQKKYLEDTYNVRPDVGYIAKSVKLHGAKKTFQITKPEIGIPLAPMLAQRLKSPQEMIKKMGTVAVEPKFDGIRIFIHYRRNGSYIRTYTRNMNYMDNSVFPELTDPLLGIGKYIDANEVILDTEAVGMDEERKGLVDFQITMQRRRKHEVAEKSKQIPLQFQVFDILLKNGESLLNTPYLERRKILEKTIKNGDLFNVDKYEVTDDPKKIEELHINYRKMGFEGVVVKSINSNYISGRTGWRWVKMKEAEDSAGKLSDTIDCVIMGFTSGQGKRTQFGVGQFLAGILDGEKIKSITKVGTGLSDDQFRELNNKLQKIIVKDKPSEYEVHKDLNPDFWVEPKEIVELAADDLTVSPKHTAGFAMRFPRLVKFRSDKSVSQITTISEVKKLYKLQKN